MHATNPHPYAQPIHTIPNELLSHIFVLGVQTGWNGLYLPLEVLVSHVCTRWREVALADQALWTRIDCVRSTQDQVAIYLERSRVAPLEVVLHWPKRGTYPNRLRAALDLALTHVHRWRSLSAVGPFTLCIKEILARLVDMECAPMLEHVVLKTFIMSVVPLIHDTPFRGNIPNLKTFSLTNIDLRWDEYNTWSDLESLTLYYQSSGNRPSFPTFARMLTSSGKLTKLVLAKSGPVNFPDKSGKYPASNPYTTHTITSLKVLELQSSATEYTIPFLTHFHCPNITKLHLDDHRDEQWDPVFEFLALPHPPAYSASILSRLAELTLYAAPVSGKLLMKAVECLDELHTLTLGGWVSEEWLSFLEHPRQPRTQDFEETASSNTTSTSSRMYMPKLTSVSFGYIVRSFHRARCIAECREKAGLPLQTLRFPWGPTPSGTESTKTSDIEDEQWLRDNVGNFVY